MNAIIDFCWILLVKSQFSYGFLHIYSNFRGFPINSQHGEAHPTPHWKHHAWSGFRPSILASARSGSLFLEPDIESMGFIGIIMGKYVNIYWDYYWDLLGVLWEHMWTYRKIMEFNGLIIPGLYIIYFPILSYIFQY